MNGSLAIIGMACRVPGAPDYRALWANLEAGTTGMVVVDERDRRREGVSLDPAISNRYVPVAAPLDGFDDFDHVAFGVGAGEANGMNLNHRVMMEVVLEALEDAGCDPIRHGGRIGLFGAGGAASPRSVLEHVGDPRYGEVDRPIRVTEALNWAALLDNDFLTTKIAYALDFRGPCLTVQTACSSSLVALHLARQSILSGDCDIAIAGGVNIESPHCVGYYDQDGSIWSNDGACRPFDRAAGGTIAGSGAGAVVLKRLADAIADGDAIHAVVRGSAINNDGSRKVGFTAPSVNQQVVVIRAALAAAGVEGREIGYLEAHGTATAVGDLVEWAAIERALGPEGMPCGLGATKANVGHLGSAAGIVGLIKAALVVEKGQMPPIANFEELNPRIAPRTDRLFVPVVNVPWGDDVSPRRAGVSSLGIGGTNAHVVLEQAPDVAAAADLDECAYVLPVSAASRRSAEDTATALADFAVANPTALRALARTVACGRRVLQHREGVVVFPRSGTVETWRTSPRSAVAKPEIAFILPGQGSKLGDLTAASVEVDGFADLLQDALGSLADADRPIVERLLTGSAQVGESPLHLELASLVQGVVVATSMIGAGVGPSALCGFSLGEIAAGVISGIFNLTDAAAVIAARAEILASAPTGAMIRVGLAEALAAPWLEPGVSLGIVPGSADCMLSGEAGAIGELGDRLRTAGIASVPIPVAHPFHSEVLSPFVPQYTEVWSQVNLRPPNIRLMSPIGGGWLDNATAVDPLFWAGHLFRQVRFGDAIRLLRSTGIKLALVLDSERGVTRFVRESFGAEAVPMVMEPQGGFDGVSSARFVASAWAAGRDDLLEARIGRDDGGDLIRRVHAPTYRFDRSESEVEGERAASSARSRPDARANSAAEPPTVLTPVRRATVPRANPEEGVQRVQRIVAQVSGTPITTVDPAASFLELGYDSFLLIQLADALATEFHAPIDVRVLFAEADTCEAVAALLGDAPEPAIVPVSERSAPSMTVSSATESRPAPVNLPGGGPTAAAGDGTTATGEVVAGDSGLRPAEVTWAKQTPISKRITEEDRFALADQRNLVATRGRREVSYPVVGVRGQGARFTDVDGRRYLDTCMGFGVMLFGHASEPVSEALRSFNASDLLIGPQSSTAGGVARGIASLTGVDRVAFTSSGTEAVMGAVRAARAKTGRDLIAVFSGSYHGTFDGVLVAPRAGGVHGASTTLGRGTPASMVSDVIVVPYDESAIPILDFHGGRLAAVLVEPVQSRRPGHQPVALLHRLRDLTSAHGAALIFDEIITGFRCHAGGAAALFGVRPDLVTYGKVLAGGMPIGVIAGDAAFMSPIDGGRWREGDVGFPQRPSMVFAGTFSKHPLTMTLAASMLAHLRKTSPELQVAMTQRTANLAARINAIAAAEGYPIEVEHFSSLYRFSVKGSALAEDMLYLAMLNRGVYVWEGRTCFLSAAHSDADCTELVDVFAEAAAEVAHSGLWGGGESDRGQSAAAPQSALAPSTSVLTDAPLTDGQLLLWIAAEIGGALAESYILQDGFRIEGSIDPMRLEMAIAHLARRHEALRIGFDEDGASQRCWDGSVPTLAVNDLGAVSPEEVLTLVQRTVVAWETLSQPSLFAFHLVRTDDASYIHVTAPHCIVDGWSIDLVWSELSASYQSGGRDKDLPAPASFLEFARWKRGEEDTRLEANDKRWSEPLLTAWKSTSPARGRGPWQAIQRVDRLPGDTLALLRELARASGCTLHNAALAAAALASSLLTGSSVFIAQAHQACQPLHTASPLIGFCVDLLPVIVELDSGASLVKVATAVQAQVVDGSAHTSGIYRIMQDRTLRQPPAELWGFNYDRCEPTTMFGAAASPLPFPRQVIPWPATVTFEQHDRVIDLITEISDSSALAPYGHRFAEVVTRTLAEPSRRIEDLRRDIQE